jgi:sugar/nucleoside kinase (ribokinase family)
VEEARLTVGGSGAIFACGAAKLGLRVVLSGVVGDDLFGRYLCDELEARGVDTRGVVVDPEHPTGLTVVLSATDDRGMLTMPGTIGELDAARVDPGLLEDARHVHVSSFFLQRRLRADLSDLFERVRDAGGTTSIDPNWDPSGSWDGGLLELLDRTDVFFPNVVEATRIGHTSDLEDAARRLGAHASVVAVKRGELGAVGVAHGRHASVRGLPVAVLDTTGAGDAFDAGFLVAWLAGEQLERALGLANACGALSTRAVGGVEGQPTMDEAIALLEGDPVA